VSNEVLQLLLEPAARYNKTPERMLQIIEEQSVATAVAEAARALPGDAGIYYDWESEQLVIRTTDGEPNLLNPARVPLRFEQARYSRAQLEAIWQELKSHALMSHNLASIGIYNRDNVLEVEVFDIESAMAVVAPYGDAVRLVKVDEPMRMGVACNHRQHCTPVRAGVEIDNNSSQICTMGPIGRRPNGNKVIVTSGHCSKVANPYPNWHQNNNMIGFANKNALFDAPIGSTVDAQRIKITTFYPDGAYAPYNRLYFGVSYKNVKVTGQVSHNNAFEGLGFWAVGRSSEHFWGEITREAHERLWSFDANVDGSLWAVVWVYKFKVSSTNVFKAGDSGGPVFIWQTGKITEEARIMGILQGGGGVNDKYFVHQKNIRDFLDIPAWCFSDSCASSWSRMRCVV
jgi:hypothetical protein